MTDTFDIAIVGGGMVGASLAAALDGLGLRLALIEAVPHDSQASPSFDERTTALSNVRRHPDSEDSRVGSGAFWIRARRCRRAGLKRHGIRRAESRDGRGAVGTHCRDARLARVLSRGGAARHRQRPVGRVGCRRARDRKHHPHASRGCRGRHPLRRAQRLRRRRRCPRL